VVVNRLGRWNGSSWSALGAGMNDDVEALALDASGALIAGGEFSTAGGAAVKRIARWNGTTWSAIGAGFGDDVEALAVDPAGVIYAAGQFTNSSSVSVRRIARWNGSAWEPMGIGLNDRARDLVINRLGQLFVGGDFSRAGGKDVDNVAVAQIGGRWDGSVHLAGGWAWSPWFGYFYVPLDPWVYQQEHGWVYAFGNDPSSVTFWDSEMADFWWTSSTQYPYLYRYSDTTWLWYDLGSDSPRWFLDIGGSAWESW
jgi:hypothetical protein